MDYPSYELYKNKYDKFLEEENRKKQGKYINKDYNDLKIEDIRKLF